MTCRQMAFGKKNYRKLSARLVFDDAPSSDQTPRADVARTRGNRHETGKVDVPRTFDGRRQEPGQKVSFGNTAYGPVQARLQFTNPPQPVTSGRPYGGYQQPPMNFAQGAFPQAQPGWVQGGFPQGGVPQGGYYQQAPMSVHQYGRPAVHWPQGRPYAGGMPVYGGGGFRVTAGGQPMINPGQYSPPPAWNGQYQVFNSRTPQYPPPEQPQGGYPPQIPGGGSFPGSNGNPEGWETAALSRGGQPDGLIPSPDGPIQYFDHRGRPVDEPAVPSDVLNPPTSTEQDATAPVNPPAAFAQPNQVYQQARQPSPGYPVGACTGGACAPQQSLPAANGGPCLNDGCGLQGGGMPQLPFPGGAPCMGGGCGVGPGVPFSMGEPCLNEGCGRGGGGGGGFTQPCSSGGCGGGTTIVQETIVDHPVSPCLGSGCMQPGGFPQAGFRQGGFPQGFGGGAPMMNHPPCPAGQVWMVANTGYG